jgi:hypothetical protein
VERLDSMAKRQARPVAANARDARSPQNRRRQIVLNLADREYETYQGMTRKSGAKDIAMMIREALRLVSVLQKQAGQGYSEVIVQHPGTLERRLVVSDFIAQSARSGDVDPP